MTRVFTLTVWIYIIAMLLSGSGSTLVAKGMSQFDISPGPGLDIINFYHPHIQTLFMFIGEFGCLFVFLSMECIRKARKQSPPVLIQGKTFYKFIPHVFLFMIPTICDLVSSTFYSMAIYYSIASIYQILRNVSVIFVALMSFMWKDFRAKFDLPQGLGLVILFLGATTVALASILFNDEQSTAVNPALGTIFTLLGAFFQSLFLVSEEIFLRKIQTIGLLGVGNEGSWGCLFYVILLPIYNVLEDPFSDIPGFKFEDVNVWAYQMGKSYEEILIHAAYIIVVLVFNFTGMEITNHVSSATRTTFDSCRSILIWIISFAVGWEQWRTDSTLTRLVGFVLITIGVLVYNNVFRIIPFLKNINIERYGKWMGRGGIIKDTDIENVGQLRDSEVPILPGSFDKQ